MRTKVKHDMKTIATNENTQSKAQPLWTAAPVEWSSVGRLFPEFIRLPKPGTLCPLTGLSRSKMNDLVLPSEANNFRPLVKSVSLRKQGQVKAVRLIVYESLRAYLHTLLAEQTREEVISAQ